MFLIPTYSVTGVFHKLPNMIVPTPRCISTPRGATVFLGPIRQDLDLAIINMIHEEIVEVLFRSLTSEDVQDSSFLDKRCIECLDDWFAMLFNVPVNNLSVMMRWSNHFLNILGIFNSYLTNGFSNRYQLDGSTFIFRGVTSDFYCLSHFSMKFLGANRIAPDGTPRSAASHLGLRCLPMSHKKDARLK